MSENQTKISTSDLIYEIGNKEVTLMVKEKQIQELLNYIKELKSELDSYNMDNKIQKEE